MNDMDPDPGSPGASSQGDTPTMEQDDPFANFGAPPSAPGSTAQHQHGLNISRPPGATVYDPTAPPSTEMNPRSCVTCRRRKVRCDKYMPCTNCRRAQIPCVFPAPERAPRRPRRKDPNLLKQQSSDRELELLKRLRKLEGIVEDLSGQIEVEATRHSSSNGGSPEGVVPGDHNAARGTERSESIISGGSHERQSPSTISGSLAARRDQGSVQSGRSQAHARGVSQQFGRLVLGEHGKARYVTSAIWSKINDELDELRAETQRLSNESTRESDLEEEPLQPTPKDDSKDHHAFILGYRSSDLDLRNLHPLASQIPYIWQVYQENVDPVIKILHVPSMNKIIRELQADFETLNPATEALMFSMYFAAITSLDDEDCAKYFGLVKADMLSQYRFAVEQSLAKAEFLTTTDIVVLQALLIHIIVMRLHDDGKLTWAFVGIAIRIAEAMGLQRDGSNFSNLSPFEAEIRRRVWWSLCLLDIRSAEDRGMDLSIIDRAFDTRMPLNINDADMHPDMKELPLPRVGQTDMTFCLIRLEIACVGRRIANSNSALCPTNMQTSLEEREGMIRDLVLQVEEKYLSDPATDGNAAYWTAANVSRIIFAKMTMNLYQPVLFSNETDGLSAEIRDRLFTAATEIFEHNYILTSDPRTKQWRWLFNTYTYWHAVAYLLVESAKREWSAKVERAWAALTSIFADHKSDEFERMAANNDVWLPFRRLFTRARKHRETELHRLRNNLEAAKTLDEEDTARAAPSNFRALSASLVARDRWRKLIGLPPSPEPSRRRQDTDTEAVSPSTTRGVPVTMQDARTIETANTVMDSVFSLPFEPSDLHDLLPVAFNPDMAQAYVGKDTSSAAAFGLGGDYSIPRQDVHLGSSVHNQLASASRGAEPVPGFEQSETPLVDSIRREGSGPPWMWEYAPANPQGSTFELPGELPSEDFDTSMGDNFDWEGFGENLKSYEADSNMPGGIWSMHTL